MRVPFVFPSSRAAALWPVLACALAAGTARAGTFDAGVSDAGEVDAGDVDAGDVDAGDVDGGDVDGGAGACAPSCDGQTLSFCDDDAGVASIDCTTVPGASRCGLLSDAWGNDCLLGEGAACDPGYGFGDSRCDRDASLFCVDGTCAVGTAPPAPVVQTPTPGTATITTTSTSSGDIFSCLGCGGTGTSGALLLGGLLLALRRVPRRRG